MFSNLVKKIKITVGIAVSLSSFNAFALDIPVRATEADKFIAIDLVEGSDGVVVEQRNLATNNNFGWDVALDGDTAVISAINEDAGGVFSTKLNVRSSYTEISTGIISPIWS